MGTHVFEIVCNTNLVVVVDVVVVVVVVASSSSRSSSGSFGTKLTKNNQAHVADTLETPMKDKQN